MSGSLCNQLEETYLESTADRHCPDDHFWLSLRFLSQSLGISALDVCRRWCGWCRIPSRVPMERARHHLSARLPFHSLPRRFLKPPLHPGEKTFRRLLPLFERLVLLLVAWGFCGSTWRSCCCYQSSAYHRGTSHRLLNNRLQWSVNAAANCQWPPHRTLRHCQDFRPVPRFACVGETSKARTT